MMMKTFLNAYVFLFLVGVVFMAAPIAAQAQEDTTPPRPITYVPGEQYPLSFVNAAGATLPYAPHTGRSRTARVVRDCNGYPFDTTFGAAFAVLCDAVDTETFYSTPEPWGVAYYGVGDTIYLRWEFDENVTVTGTPKLEFWFKSHSLAVGGDGHPGSRCATLKAGEGNGSSNTLTFEYTVEPGDYNPGLTIVSAFCRPHDFSITNNHDFSITDNVGNEFDPISLGDFGWFVAKPTARRVDGISPSVRITGVISADSETHDGDYLKQEVFVETLEHSVLQAASPVRVSGVKTGPFTVEIRFYENLEILPYPTHVLERTDVAEEPVGFEGDDIQVTDASGNVLAWHVSPPTFIGLDHRATLRGAHGHEGRAGNKAYVGEAIWKPSFAVYKVTITPTDFDGGEVSIQVPAGATQDIAGNPNHVSNTLTVSVGDLSPPVVQSLRFVETASEIYTVGDEIAVEVTFDEDGVRHDGGAANPPYLTLYLGERTLANERHATWQPNSERTGSTVVTFVYPIQFGDAAESVSVKATGISVPVGVTVSDADGNQIVGASSRAEPPGTAPDEETPASDMQLRFEDATLREIRETEEKKPVHTIFPVLETADPKSPASDVPRSPLVFNELGNGSGAANDWLELRNVTGSAVSLKDWELSVVQDDKKEDTSLIVFPDASVPANGLLLVTNSAPEKTPLAGGEKRGLSHAFLVDAGLSLPDDGKFLLILRNAKDKLGMNAAFVDVAGGGGSDTDAFVREQTGDYDTHVWPLQVLQAPGGDTEDALSSGKVWQRAKADIIGYHKDAWAEAAFTGIGYDRNVSKSAATAGTPGYPNGAVKTAAATPKGAITISEVMFDSGGGTLPQWIELYNASKTEALNLNRWQLEFQNVDSEDLVGRPIVALTLQEKVIQPNQTLLLVAGAARASSADVFPADRVYNLLALHQRNLRIKTARDTFLSAEGFYLKLTDGNGNLVDEVGNTDGNRRTKDAPAWALPVSGEAGVRSSLIRRYKDNVARDGKEKASWVLSANIRQVATGELHYGHAEDIGTPGYRKGGALPVELSSFTVARTEAGAVVVTWTTESEVDNAGFNLRRSERRDSGFTLLNAALIAGAGTTGERQTYTYMDTSAKPGVAYYYQIEEVAFDGRPATLVTRRLRGPVSPAHRQLTMFGAVKQQAK